MTTHLCNLLEATRTSGSRIHCITNYISARDCANAILALGGKPIMAEHPREVEEVTGNAKSLYLNLGSLSDSKMEGMLRSVQVAKEKKIPVVLDLTGVGGSQLRREFVKEMLTVGKPQIIKGNVTEVYGWMENQRFSCGVDALEEHLLSKEEMRRKKGQFQELIKGWETTLVITGNIDWIVEEDACFFVENGTHRMGEMTGSGCVLGSLLATFLGGTKNPFSKEDRLQAALLASIFYGVCGELANMDCLSEKGTWMGIGSFGVRLLDWLQTCEVSKLKERARWNRL